MAEAAVRTEQRCHICGADRATAGTLSWLFGRWMCRDRVDCYQRFRGR